MDGTQEQVASARQMAISMNGQAIEMIECGEFLEAADHFALAMSTFRGTVSPSTHGDTGHGILVSLDQCLLQHRPSLSLTGAKNMNPHAVLLQEFFSRSIATTASRRRSLSSSEGTDGLDTSFIHHRPISIPEELGRASSANSCIQISIILLFNLSLAYQLVALLEMVKKSKHALSPVHGNRDPAEYARRCLGRAARLYEMCLSLLNDASVMGNLGNNTVFNLVVANNLGVLFTQLNDSHSATACFERSMSILMLLVEYKAQDQVHYFSGFLSNAIQHICPASSGARAA